MAKRTAQTHSTFFDLDLESLLAGENSQEKEIDFQIFGSESPNEPKKFKSKDDEKVKVLDIARSEVDCKENVENVNMSEDPNDVTTFFEIVGTDFNKSLQVRKSRLGQFTEKVVSIYHSRITDLVKKQEAETEIFKEQALNKILEDMNKFKDGLNKLKSMETKLMSVLDQQIKLMQKTGAVQEQWAKDFANLHQHFFKEYEKLTNKHKNEAMELTKTLSAEAFNLQENFIAESKNEEMQTMKKYLSTVYF